MPVVVTAADGPLGRAVVTALRARGVEVRAVVPAPEGRAALAGLGARTAVCDLDDGVRLGAVLGGAHTLVHLDRPASTADLVLDAAEGTSLRRVVAVARGPVPAYGPLELVVVPGDLGEADAGVVAAVVAADARRSP